MQFGKENLTANGLKILFILITLKIPILILHLILGDKPSLNLCNIFQLVNVIYK